MVVFQETQISLRSCTAEGEPGEENCPDTAGGYCPAGGLHSQGVLWWEKEKKKSFCEGKRLCWNSFVMKKMYDKKKWWWKLKKSN